MRHPQKHEGTPLLSPALLEDRLDLTGVPFQSEAMPPHERKVLAVLKADESTQIDDIVEKLEGVRVTGLIMTQILPFADPRVLALYGRFERAIYEALPAA